MLINSLPELYKGLSDIPIVIVAIIFGILLYNNKDKEHRDGGIFFLVAICGLGGIILHSFSMNYKLHSILWGILYLFLYILVGAFSTELIALCNAKTKQGNSIIHFVGIICFVASCLCLYKNNGFDIYVFVLYAALALINCLITIKKYGKFDKFSIFMFIFIILAIIFQAFKTIVPYGVAWGHICLIFSEISLFLMAKKHNKSH